MKIIQGQGVSRGVATGPIHFWDFRLGTVSKCHVENGQRERERLENALQCSAEQFLRLAHAYREAFDEDGAGLLEAYAMLTRDVEYTSRIYALLEGEHCNAEYALMQAGETLAAWFAAMDDAYLRERAADIRDVTERILRNLTGDGQAPVLFSAPVILAAQYLSPATLLQLDAHQLLGLLIGEGAYHSHTAILARGMGIPMISDLGEALTESLHGQTVWLDGETGEAVFAPDAPMLMAFHQKEEEQRRMAKSQPEEPVFFSLPEKGGGQEQKSEQTSEEAAFSLLAQSRERQELHRNPEELIPGEIRLYGNINTPKEVDAVIAHGGEGIGLYRSEFQYLAAGDWPTEEELFSAYRAAAAAMEGRTVVVRTLDMGADKEVSYLGMKKERNPALGIRGIRLCIKRPEIFHTQLRALYRASAYGKIAILFPMITSLGEIRICKEACQGVMEELRREGIPFREDTRLGIMIETPAAVFLAEEMAGEVDFFSVGTNDLTQYILAWDRQSNAPDRFYDPHHQAVLRAIGMAAEAAHKAGISIGICGELAADFSLLPRFRQMGIDVLSVAPSSLIQLREALRRSEEDA